MSDALRPLVSAVCLAAALFGASAGAYAQSGSVRAEGGSFAAGGNVDHSTINIGVPLEKVDELVKQRTQPLEDLTAAQRETIRLLKDKLDLNERQVRSALDILSEANVPPERLAAKLVEIAERYQALKASVATLTGDDPETKALQSAAQQAIDNGELEKADALLAEVQANQTRALDRLAFNAAQTTARRGDIALTRLRYREAAEFFANAAATLPPNSEHEQERVGWLHREANALYRQGDEFGDNDALAAAIERFQRLLGKTSRERVPLDWAMTQNNLGLALTRLGERESGTARLDEAVAAFRDELKERTRGRVPLDWAYSLQGLANALAELAKRQNSSARLREAIACLRGAVEVLRQGADEYARPVAEARLSELEADLAKMKR